METPKKKCAPVTHEPNAHDENFPYRDIIEDTYKEQKKLKGIANQQERTLRKKRALLKQRRMATLSTVTELCKAAGIESTKTFYNWYNNDQYFRVAYDTIGDITIEFVQGILMTKIAQKDFASIRYYLEHQHPSYMKQRDIDERLARYLKEHKEEKEFIGYFRIG
jgi:hypothetical protein